MAEPSARAKALKRSQDDLKKQHETQLLDERKGLLDKLEQNRTDLAFLGYTFKTKLENENEALKRDLDIAQAEIEKLRKKRS